jgi:hypothetical protein
MQLGTRPLGTRSLGDSAGDTGLPVVEIVGTLRHKAAGVFTLGIIRHRTGGVFTDGIVKHKTGGAFAP